MRDRKVRGGCARGIGEIGGQITKYNGRLLSPRLSKLMNCEVGLGEPRASGAPGIVIFLSRGKGKGQSDAFPIPGPY